MLEHCPFPKGVIQGKIDKVNHFNEIKGNTMITTSTKKIKKRFIAGAVCSECKETDTLALTKEHDVETVTCVACGAQMSQPEEHVADTVRANEQVIGIFKQE